MLNVQQHALVIGQRCQLLIQVRHGGVLSIALIALPGPVETGKVPSVVVSGTGKIFDRFNTGVSGGAPRVTLLTV